MKRGGVFFAALLLAASGHATLDYSSQTGLMPALQVGVGPRAEGMGEAFTALADDAFALSWNPAGLTHAQDMQMAFSHNEWNTALGLRQEYLAWTQALDTGGLGLALNYFSLGDLELRDDTGALKGKDSGSDLGLSLGYATELRGTGLSLGLALEGAREALPGSSSIGFGGSLGLLYEREHLSIGASLLHAGTGGPSMQGALGVAYHMASDRLRLAVDCGLPLGLDALSVKAGAEGNIYGPLWLRAGWRQATGSTPFNDPRTGFTAGLGLSIRKLQIDYAYVPSGDFAPAHRVSASLRFSPKVFSADDMEGGKSATQTAQALFLEGKSELGKGKKLDALVAFKQSLQADPSRSDVSKAIDALRHEIEQGQSSGKVDSGAKAMLNKKISSAQAFAKKGEYRKAIADYEIALELDKGSQTAKAGLDSAKNSLKSRVESLLILAGQAASADDMASASRNYRSAWAMDPNDPRAPSALESLRPRLLNEIKHLHRAGIDDYVAGRIDKALASWRGGLEMDPADPYHLKRDIEKAEALLQIKHKAR